MGLKEELKALLEKVKKKVPPKTLPPLAQETEPAQAHATQKQSWKPYFKLSREKDDSATNLYRGSW